MNLLKILLIIIGLAAIAALSYFFFETPVEPTTNATADNITDSSDVAEFGDLVEIDYVLRLENGTVADTNNAELAREAGLENYMHGPMKFILGQSGKVKGFDEAIAGMTLGTSDIKIIPPSQKELYIQVNKSKPVHRFKAIQRKQGFDLRNYEEVFGKPPVIGDIIFNYDIFPWKYQVINITDKYAIANMIVKDGETYVLPSTYWPSKVFQAYTDIVSFYMTPEDNQTIETEWGTAFINKTRQTMYINYQVEVGQIFDRSVKGIGGFKMEMKYQAVDMDSNTFTVKRIGLLEDKTLKLEVTLREIVKNVKKVKKNLVVKETPIVAEA